MRRSGRKNKGERDEADPAVEAAHGSGFENPERIFKAAVFMSIPRRSNDADVLSEGRGAVLPLYTLNLLFRGVGLC